MDLSPPSLTRSPASSSNTCSPSSVPCDYPSPDFVDAHYKLSSMYDNVSGTASNMDNSLPPLGSVTSTDWVHASSSAGSPVILSAGYDPFATYEPSLSTPYSHDMYPVLTSNALPIPHSPQQYHRTHSRSPGLSHTYSMSSNSRRRSGTSLIKSESVINYNHDVEASDYPSPHSVHAVPVEIGSHRSAAGSLGYLSDVQSGSWLKSEYPPLDSDQVASCSGTSYLGDQQSSYRSQRGSRRPQRRLTTKDEANFQCEVKGCGKLFSRSYNYKAHLETHDEKREYPFPCQMNECSKRFVRKTDLQRHHQSVHMKEKNHKCDFCGRLFARKDTLRRHMGDGCPKRFDVGTLDFRSEGHDSHKTRARHLAVSLHLAPLAVSQPGRPSHNLLASSSGQMR